MSFMVWTSLRSSSIRCASWLLACFSCLLRDFCCSVSEALADALALPVPEAGLLDDPSRPLLSVLCLPASSWRCFPCEAAA